KDDTAWYNAGTAALADSDAETARGSLTHAAASLDPDVRFRALFNLGLLALHEAMADSAARDSRLADAERAYREALLLRPHDLGAKWNLELAVRRQHGGSSRSNPPSGGGGGPPQSGGGGGASQGRAPGGARRAGGRTRAGGAEWPPRRHRGPHGHGGQCEGRARYRRVAHRAAADRRGPTARRRPGRARRAHRAPPRRHRARGPAARRDRRRV